jgi:hypothetical protein
MASTSLGQRLRQRLICSTQLEKSWLLLVARRRRSQRGRPARKARCDGIFQSRGWFRSKAGRSPRLSCAHLLGRRGTSFFGNAIGSKKFARYWCTHPGAQLSAARSFSECHRKWKILDLDERRTAQLSTLHLANSVLGNAEFREHHRDANFSGICSASPAEPRRRICCFERAQWAQSPM